MVTKGFQIKAEKVDFNRYKKELSSYFWHIYDELALELKLRDFHGVLWLLANRPQKELVQRHLNDADQKRIDEIYKELDKIHDYCMTYHIDLNSDSRKIEAIIDYVKWMDSNRKWSDEVLAMKYRKWWCTNA